MFQCFQYMILSDVSSSTNCNNLLSFSITEVNQLNHKNQLRSIQKDSIFTKKGGGGQWKMNKNKPHGGGVHCFANNYSKNIYEEVQFSGFF